MPPTKADKKRHRQKSKQNGKERADNKHRHTYKNTTIQCIIYVKENTKTSKNKAGRTNNAEAIQSSAPDTRKTKNARPKTAKTTKEHSQEQSNENKQRKQQHYLCSKKLYKRQKNVGKIVNTEINLFTTENTLRINGKSPKGHQNGKTVQRGQPCLSQARCQRVNKKFSVSI